MRRSIKTGRLARALTAVVLAASLALSPLSSAATAALAAPGPGGSAQAQDADAAGATAAQGATTPGEGAAADGTSTADGRAQAPEDSEQGMTVTDAATIDDGATTATDEGTENAASSEGLLALPAQASRAGWGPDVGTCFNVRTDQHYDSIYEALNDTAVQSGDTIAMIATADTETETIDIPAYMNITITTADGVDSCVVSFATTMRNGSPLFRVHSGATLVIDGTKNGQEGSEHNGIVLDGSASTGVMGIQVGAINDTDGTLSLTDVTVQNFDAGTLLNMTDRRAAGISAYRSDAILAGTTLVTACKSSFVGDAVYHKTAGGIAVVGDGRNKNTAKLEMGRDATVSGCAGETGGVTVNGGGYAHIQGTVTGNRTLSTGVAYHCAGGIYIGGEIGNGHPGYNDDPAMTGWGGKALLEGAVVTSNESFPSNVNTLQPSAGGIFVDAGRLTIHGATIVGNSTSSYGRNSGGGVAMDQERATNGTNWGDTTMIAGLTISGKIVAKDNTVGSGANTFTSNINLSSDLVYGTQVLRVDGDLTPDSYVGITATMGNRVGSAYTFPAWPTRNEDWQATFSNNWVPLRSYPGVEFGAAVSADPEKNDDVYQTGNASARYTEPGNPDFPYSIQSTRPYDRVSYNGNYSGDARRIANLNTLVNDYDSSLRAVAAPADFVPYLHDYNSTGYMPNRSLWSTAFSPGYTMTSPYGSAAIIWGLNNNGTLKVTKQLAVEDGAPYGVDREFTFTAKTSTTDGSDVVSYTGVIYNADGTSANTYVTATPEGAEFKLKAGQYLLFSGLPTGGAGETQTSLITVSETDDSSTVGPDPTRAYATTVEEANGWGSTDTDDSGAASWTGFPTYYEKTDEVTFTNTLRMGSLSVKKTVTDVSEDIVSPSFDFTLTVTLPTGVSANVSDAHTASLAQAGGTASTGATPKVVEVEPEIDAVGPNGTLTYKTSVTGGSVLTVPNLPVGSTYTFSEGASGGYRATAVIHTLDTAGDDARDTKAGVTGQGLSVSYAGSPSADTGETDKARIAYAGPDAADATPNIVDLTNARMLGSLHISEQTTGTFANLDGEFGVTVTLTLPDGCTLPAGYAATKTDSSAAGAGVPSSAVQAEDGTAYTFKTALAHGDSLDFDELPEGTTYAISEEGISGYTVSAAVSTFGAQAETVTGETGKGVSFAYAEASDTATGKTKNAIVAATSTKGADSPNKVLLTNAMADVAITGLTLPGGVASGIVAVVGVALSLSAVVGMARHRRRG